MFICTERKRVPFLGGHAIEKKLLVIGAGRMGSELVESIMKSGGISPCNVVVAGRNGKVCEKIEKLGVKAECGKAEAVSWADAALVCVKPHDMDSLACEVNGALEGKLIISIAAATSAGRLGGLFSSYRIIRAMPDIGAASGCSYTALFADSRMGEEDFGFARQLFSLVGKTVRKTEDQLDAHTVMAACTPAFAAEFILALDNGQGGIESIARSFRSAANFVLEESRRFKSAGGRLEGPGGRISAKAGAFEFAVQAIHLMASSRQAVLRYGYKDSLSAVSHAFLSSAGLIIEGQKSPAEIRDAVASPKGITAMGLELLHGLGMGRLQEVVDAMLNAVFEKRR